MFTYTSHVGILHSNLLHVDQSIIGPDFVHYPWLLSRAYCKFEPDDTWSQRVLGTCESHLCSASERRQRCLPNRPIDGNHTHWWRTSRRNCNRAWKWNY